MTLNGCSLICGSARLNHKTYNSKSYYSASSSVPRLPANVTSSCTKSSWRPCQQLQMWSSKGSTLLHLAAASTPLLSGNQGSLSNTIPVLPRRRRPLMAPRASPDDPYSFRYPAMTRKPRWWWRTLACLPYLLPLHETWMYAETAYNLHQFLEQFEFFTYPFLEALGRLPSWFLLAYFVLAYLCVVRKKEWPHFLRFHVATAMLLEIVLQSLGIMSRWMPKAAYWGMIGMHLWTALAFAFLFTVLECMRCVLAGKYADIPFVSDAAYIQIPYD